MFLRRAEVQVGDKRIPYGIPKGMVIREPGDVFRAFGFLSEGVQEEVYALYMDIRQKVIGFYQVSKGSIDLTVFKPADVLRPALLVGAASIILVHNHTSGDPEPSLEDRQMTIKMREACSILGLVFHDHVVIGRDDYRSIISMVNKNEWEV